ncbi:MAG: trigger factor [Gammaproteobacteria bacterium]|nr:trigger factor [Gammaproteobacteria bacterium]NNJ79813.1 trigger factor [Xanthomonadales bacterium]
MHVSVENTGGLERKLTIQVPGDEIQQKVDGRLKELSKQVRIKGFRPGRVPMSVVRQRYGKQAKQEIVSEAIQNSLQQAIADEKLRPAAMPRLDAPPRDLDNGDLEFDAVIEVYPEIDTIDTDSLEIEKLEADVEDGDVDEMLKTLREQRRSWEEVERAAKEDDQVVIEFAAEGEEGRVPEEGTTRMAIVIGGSGFEEMEKLVTGLKAGDEKKKKLAFPEGFREAALAGTKAKAEIAVVKVAEPQIPEVDEAFIESFGIEDGTLDGLKAEIRGNLERELKQARVAVLKNGLVDALLATVPELEVPQAVVRDEAAGMAAQILSSQGQEPDQALVQQLAGQFMEPAEKRVRAGLMMGELAQQNGIRVDAAKVREAIETVASTYEQPAEVVQLYYSNERLMQQVESSVLEEQVVDWVLEHAKVTPKKTSFQEVIAAATNSGE